MSQNRRSKVETEGGRGRRRRDGEEEEEENSGSRSFHDEEEEDDLEGNGNNNSDNDSDDDDDDDDDDNYDDNDDDDDDFSSSSDDDEEEAAVVLGRKNMNRSILWLCQEGQIKVARKRFQALLQQQRQQQEINNNNVTNDNNNNKNTTTDQSLLLLKKEIFRIDKNDKNYPIHELLMGGTNDNNAFELVNLILDTSSSKKQCWNGEYLTMLIAQPPSHRRTALHWATWSNAKFDVIKKLVLGNPEALVVKDGINQGCRTPLELYKHYYGHHLVENNDLSHNIGSRNNRRRITRTAGIQQQEILRCRPQHSIIKEKIDYLEKTTKSWIQHRLRLEIYRCAISLFRRKQKQRNLLVVPFNQQHRKLMKIKPQPWFVISIIGYLLQREIQPLALHVLSFVGKDAKVCYHSSSSSSSNNNKRKKKKRKR